MSQKLRLWFKILIFCQVSEHFLILIAFSLNWKERRDNVCVCVCLVRVYLSILSPLACKQVTQTNKQTNKLTQLKLNTTNNKSYRLIYVNWHSPNAKLNRMVWYTIHHINNWNFRENNYSGRAVMRVKYAWHSHWQIVILMMMMVTYIIEITCACVRVCVCVVECGKYN